MKYLIAIIVVLTLLTTACEENPPSVEIVGPIEAKVGEDVYLEARATGATPVFGFISFDWEKRVGKTGAWTYLGATSLGVDVNGNAIDWWIEEMPAQPGIVEYKVLAAIVQSHSIDRIIYRVDSHEIKVVE